MAPCLCSQPDNDTPKNRPRPAARWPGLRCWPRCAARPSQSTRCLSPACHLPCSACCRRPPARFQLATVRAPCLSGRCTSVRVPGPMPTTSAPGVRGWPGAPRRYAGPRLLLPRRKAGTRAAGADLPADKYGTFGGFRPADCPRFPTFTLLLCLASTGATHLLPALPSPPGWPCAAPVGAGPRHSQLMVPSLQSSGNAEARPLAWCRPSQGWVWSFPTGPGQPLRGAVFSHVQNSPKGGPVTTDPGVGVVLARCQLPPQRGGPAAHVQNSTPKVRPETLLNRHVP